MIKGVKGYLYRAGLRRGRGVEKRKAAKMKRRGQKLRQRKR